MTITYQAALDNSLAEVTMNQDPAGSGYFDTCFSDGIFDTPVNCYIQIGTTATEPTN